LSMAGKHDFCLHDGPITSNGKCKLLSFCLLCNEPMISDILDMVAYLKKPRILQNGKVKAKTFLYALVLIQFTLKVSNLN
jgi:hypothetical protein